MTTNTTPAEAPAPTASDMFLSLNGFDEIAVAKAFKADIADLRERPFAFLRALAFVHRRRAGDKDAEAYKTVMGMSIGEAGDYFAEEPDDAGLDDDDQSAEGNEPSPEEPRD